MISPEAPSRQAGVVLAMALMFLALMTATATVGPAVANLELLRAGALEAWSRADAAATTGIDTALGEADLASTTPDIVASGTLAAARYSVRREFLGFRTATAGLTESGLVEWHFLLTSTGTADRGARTVQALEIAVLAPEPPDRDDCLSTGCPVPPICVDASPCDPGLRSPPAPVGWYMPSDAS